MAFFFGDSSTSSVSVGTTESSTAAASTGFSSSTGLSSAGLSSTGLSSAGFSSVGFSSAGLSSAGFSSTGFSSAADSSLEARCFSTRSNLSSPQDFFKNSFPSLVKQKKWIYGINPKFEICYYFITSAVFCIVRVFLNRVAILISWLNTKKNLFFFFVFMF